MANFGNSESGPFDHHLGAIFSNSSNGILSADHASNFAAGPLDEFTILLKIRRCGAIDIDPNLILNKKFFRPGRVYRGALSREVSLYCKKSIFAGKSTLVNAP